MKIYKNENVWDAALTRIRYIFSEFPNVVVGISGGKDSTVIMNLALKVAEELNRLPLEVMFLDQEAEWQHVIDFIRSLKADKRISLKWYQIPIKIENATSNTDSYLITWEPGKEWMREMEPDSIREGYSTKIFYELFAAVLGRQYPNEKACYLGGVRTEESPTRFAGLTGGQTYKAITYGKRLNKEKQHFTFYPLYDWSYTDVWKAIHDNNWPYCKVYDFMYQQGVTIQAMRISNLNHETATHSLYYLPEVEKDTWEKLCRRLSGINSVGKISKLNTLTAPKVLPYMFSSWPEYRDYLLENMITDPVIKKTMFTKFQQMDRKYGEMHHLESLYKAQISTILANDSWLTKLVNWERKPEVHGWRQYQRGIHHPKHAENKFING